MEHGQNRIGLIICILGLVFGLCMGCYVMAKKADIRVEFGPTAAPVASPTPSPAPTVSFVQQAFLIQARADAESQRVDDSIRHAVVIHELRRETLYDVAVLAMPWAAIVIGGACFVALVRKQFSR